MKRIFFTGDTLTKQERAEYLAKGYQIDGFDVNLTKDQIVSLLNRNGYEGYILGGNEILDKDTIERFPDTLKVISFFGVGYESYIDTISAERKAIHVTNTPDANSIAVAEHTIGFIINLVRNIVKNANNSSNDVWVTNRVDGLEGKTVGIIGMGRIGQTVARMLYYGFNMKVIYYSRTRKENLEQELNTYMVSLPELLSQSDVISIHASFTDETRELIGSSQFELMKQTAILINTARSDIIDRQALYEAIANNRIAGCVLDTFYKEPINLTEDDRFSLFTNLFDKNLIITPHLAYFSKSALNSMQNIAIQNVIDVLEDKECHNVVKGISKYINNLMSFRHYDSSSLKYKILLADASNYKKDLYNKVANAFGKENVFLFNDVLNMGNSEVITDNNPKILMIDPYYLNQKVMIDAIKEINNLKALCVGGVYFNNIDLDYCDSKHITVTSIPNYRVKSPANHAMFLLKGLANKTALFAKSGAKATLLDIEPIALENKKVGIIGFDNLGIELATLCHEEGMRVSYYDLVERNSRFKYSSLEDVLQNSDFIILANMSLFDQIKLNPEALDMISKKAFVISAGYESLYQTTLIEKVEDNQLAGYAAAVAGNMLDYRGNILLVGDNNTSPRENYYVLMGAWIEEVRKIIEDNPID